MYEQVNSMPSLAGPLTNINIPKPIVGAAPPLANDVGSGTIQVLLKAGQKRIIPLSSLSTSSINDGGDITLQASAAVTVQVTSGNQQHVEAETQKLASAGALSAALWQTVAITVNEIEVIPRNTTAVYMTAASDCLVVLRRT